MKARKFPNIEALAQFVDEAVLNNSVWGDPEDGSPRGLEIEAQFKKLVKFARDHEREVRRLGMILGGQRGKTR